VTLQIGLHKDKALPDVPLVMDLTDDAQKKAALKLIVSRQIIARPFAAPPGVPADQARVLRSAFEAATKDPEFLAEAKISITTSTPSVRPRSRRCSRRFTPRRPRLRSSHPNSCAIRLEAGQIGAIAARFTRADSPR
jgi:hypothetical protein